MKGVIHVELCTDSTKIRAAKNWKGLNKCTCTTCSSYMTTSNILTHTVDKKLKIKKKTQYYIYMCVIGLSAGTKIETC